MSTGSPVTGDLDLQSYLEVARRRWRVILLVTLLIPAISILISLRQEPRYAASSEVLVKRQNLAASLTPGQVPYTDAQTAERVVETQVQLARVPDLADRVIGAAGLSGTYTAADLLDSSTVTKKENSDILVFRVEWPSASTARQLAGLYGEQFTTYRRQLDTSELDTLSSSVSAQLASLDASASGRSPLYADLQDKLQQIQTLQALQTSSAVVVRTPNIATEVGPTPLTMATGGLLLGLILGGCLAFLLESLDNRVRRSSDVAAILGLPLLARLPRPATSRRKRPGLVVMEDPESPAAEAFAFLRTNLSFANMTSGARVIMSGSAVEQEGKSTTISNLAVALARTGKRVVLVDLDYRRPTIHSFFSLPRGPGVTEVMGGRIDIRRALHQVPIWTDGDTPAAGVHARDFLEVLPAGGTSHGIEVDAISDLLDRLRDHADIILVDAPPLLLVGEALALSAKVDALIVITRLNHVRRPMLEELRQAFDTAPVNVLGFVVTGANEEPGYSHYYRKAYDSIPDDEGQQDSSPTSTDEQETERDGPPAQVKVPVARAVNDGGDPLRAAVPDRGSGPANGGSRQEPGSRSVAGLQPRRSWAQTTDRARAPSAEEVVDEDVPSTGTAASASLNGNDGVGEGTSG